MKVGQRTLHRARAACAVTALWAVAATAGCGGRSVASPGRAGEPTSPTPSSANDPTPTTPQGPSSTPVGNPSSSLGCVAAEELAFEGQQVPFGSTDDGFALRWDTSTGCVPVTMAADATVQRDRIERAVSAWNAFGCDAFCLGPVKRAEGAFDPESRAIHFVLQLGKREAELPTTVFHNRAGCRIIGAQVALDTAHPATLVPGGVAHALGHVVGLAHAGDAVSSVMSKLSPDNPATPTSIDGQALCALYGGR